MLAQILLIAQVIIPINVIWSPNPTVQEVFQYIVTIDQGTPYTILSSTACKASQCVLYVPTMTEGKHQVWVTAQNIAGKSPNSKVVSFTCKKTGSSTSCK
jgi:hypothetical protein